jgi:hypothetical protein
MTALVNVREVIELALDTATVEAARDVADIFRRLRSGQEWQSATMQVVLDRYGRHKRDVAIAKALLAELGHDGPVKS